VYIRDGCQDLLLTAVELYLHYLLTI
jgi:hypothetical protein